VRIPVAEWNGAFAWTVWAKKKTVESVFAKQATFEEYVEDRLDFSKEYMAKDDLPGIWHGLVTDGRRKKESFQYVGAVVLDCDGGRRPNLDFLECDYLYEERTTHTGITKWHIVLPIARRVDSTEADSEMVRKRLIFVTEAFEKLFGAKLDHSTPTVVPALLFPYCERPDSGKPYIEAVTDSGYAFDLDTFLSENGYVEGLKRAPVQIVAARDITLAETEMVKALRDGGYLLRPAPDKGGWFVKCPWHDRYKHTETGESKTLFSNGHIMCMSERCSGKPLSHFIAALPDHLRERVESAQVKDVYAALKARAVPKVTLAEAQSRIVAALESARPFERTATVIRVTTGAGKTFAAARFLNTYCAATDGESSGRSAVMATPTNALLEEVRQRLVVPTRKQVGVLAVLNDDGSPACRKHEAARRLQDRGGNVHQLMCAALRIQGRLPRSGRARERQRFAHLDEPHPLACRREDAP
jgi:hypothetical protein